MIKVYIYIYIYIRYIYIYIYIYTYIYTHTYMYIINNESNVPLCRPVYHHNDFVATHALGHRIYGWAHDVYIEREKKKKRKEKFHI